MKAGAFRWLRAEARLVAKRHEITSIGIKFVKLITDHDTRKTAAAPATGKQGMKFGEIVRIVDGTVLTRSHDSMLEIECVAGCDLMSDVLTYSRPEALLLTGLTNAHVVRTAEMADISAIVFVRGKMPEAEVIALAEEKGIPLASSPLTMFELCGRLYQAGLVSCDAGVRD